MATNLDLRNVSPNIANYLSRYSSKGDMSKYQGPPGQVGQQELAAQLAYMRDPNRLAGSGLTTGGGPLQGGAAPQGGLLTRRDQVQAALARMPEAQRQALMQAAMARQGGGAAGGMLAPSGGSPVQPGGGWGGAQTSQPSAGWSSGFGFGGMNGMAAPSYVPPMQMMPISAAGGAGAGMYGGMAQQQPAQSGFGFGAQRPFWGGGG
ncbi:hypothetical protein [Sphingomonas sp.]|jgi:hypothetical protein|uniref:hypothetical protein n=1 Tax=Sphingomonas sp. TaxID=28214 RepID=UPI0035686397